MRLDELDRASGRDIMSLAERIDGDELASQRLGFEPAQFQSAPARQKRGNPFRRN